MLNHHKLFIFMFCDCGKPRQIQSFIIEILCVTRSHFIYTPEAIELKIKVNAEKKLHCSGTMLFGIFIHKFIDLIFSLIFVC